MLFHGQTRSLSQGILLVAATWACALGCGSSRDHAPPAPPCEGSACTTPVVIPSGEDADAETSEASATDGGGDGTTNEAGATDGGSDGTTNTDSTTSDDATTTSDGANDGASEGAADDGTDSGSVD